MIRLWLASAACAFVCLGCSGKMQHDYDLHAMGDGSFMGVTELADERGELHLAVYEMLLARSELPFGFGGHEGAQRDRVRRQAAAIGPKANELLRERGSVNLIGGGSAIKITISRKSRTLSVTWLADRGDTSSSFFVDLSAVEGAFNPRARLDVAQVERAVIFLKGD